MRKALLIAVAACCVCPAAGHAAQSLSPSAGPDSIASFWQESAAQARAATAARHDGLVRRLGEAAAEKSRERLQAGLAAALREPPPAAVPGPAGPAPDLGRWLAVLGEQQGLGTASLPMPDPGPGSASPGFRVASHGDAADPALAASPFARVHPVIALPPRDPREPAAAPADTATQSPAEPAGKRANLPPPRQADEPLRRKPRPEAAADPAPRPKRAAPARERAKGTTAARERPSAARAPESRAPQRVPDIRVPTVR